MVFDLIEKKIKRYKKSFHHMDLNGPLEQGHWRTAKEYFKHEVHFQKCL